MADDVNHDIPLAVSIAGLWNDRPRRLKITTREIDQIESALGKPIGAVAEDFRQLGYNTFATILWAAADDKNLKLGDVKKALQRKVDAGEDLLDLRVPLNNALILSGVFGQEAIDRLRAPDGNAAGGNGHPPDSSATG